MPRGRPSNRPPTAVDPSLSISRAGWLSRWNRTLSGVTCTVHADTCSAAISKVIMFLKANNSVGSGADICGFRHHYALERPAVSIWEGGCLECVSGTTRVTATMASTATASLNALPARRGVRARYRRYPGRRRGCRALCGRGRARRPGCGGDLRRRRPMSSSYHPAEEARC